LSPALADSDGEARLRDQLKKVIVQLREAQDEASALQAKQAAVDKQTQDFTAQIDALKQQLAGAKGQSAGALDAKKSLDAAETRAKAAEGQLAQLQTTLTKWQDAYKQAADVARTRDADAKSLAATNAGLQDQATRCVAKNVALYKTASEILDRYAHIGWDDVLEQKEIFTQHARVELENQVQDYDDKLRDQKLSPAAPHAGG
jgi:chromosome segregation ATPase